MNLELREQVLNEQEARVIHLRDEMKWTLRRIGDELGISQERVRQSHRHAHEKLEDVAQHGEEALSLLPDRAVTAAELATQFSRAKAADLEEILESLVTLGRARKDREKFVI